MKRLCALALLIPLAACSPSSPPPGTLTANPPAPAAPVTSVTPTPTPTPTGPAKSARGNLIKDIGQKAGTVDPSTGKALIDFTVTAIEPDFTCTAKYADKPTNGHYLAITLDITTSPDWNSDESWMSFQSDAWSVVSPEGKTENDSSGQGYTCVDSSQEVPYELGPGEHVEGKVILDTAYTSGAIVLKIPGQSVGGWEWSFGG